MVFATNATYSADVSSLAVIRVNSSLSVNLTNQSCALAGAIVTNATDHFGIEAWVKPMAVNGTSQVIVYNGNTSTSGWGIFLDVNNNYSGLFGGAAIIPGASAQAGVQFKTGSHGHGLWEPYTRLWAMSLESREHGS